MKYTEVTFTIEPFNEAVADALIAGLGGIGYNGFSYTDKGFTTYIPTREYREKDISELPYRQFFSGHFRISASHREIEEQNWNRSWEETFTPVIIDKLIRIRAGYHPSVPEMAYDIIIEPKMSFGTGHHPTTALMLRSIVGLSGRLENKRVLDMGCGTGILSIMAAKAGAGEVTGIDKDEWAVDNARENIRRNGLDNIVIKIGDAGLLEHDRPFDVILANINRNILLEDMVKYTAKLRPDGDLIVSGFYLRDLPLLRDKAASLGLRCCKVREEQEWAAVSFCKSDTDTFPEH